MDHANLPHHPANNTCVVCIKVYRSSSGLKRHMVIHRRIVGHTDSNRPTKDTKFICHIYIIPLKLNAGLKSRLRGHRRQNDMEAITSDAKSEDTATI